MYCLVFDGSSFESAETKFDERCFQEILKFILLTKIALILQISPSMPCFGYFTYFHILVDRPSSML